MVAEILYITLLVGLFAGLAVCVAELLDSVAIVSRSARSLRSELRRWRKRPRAGSRKLREGMTTQWEGIERRKRQLAAGNIPIGCTWDGVERRRAA